MIYALRRIKVLAFRAQIGWFYLYSYPSRHVKTKGREMHLTAFVMTEKSHSVGFQQVARVEFIDMLNRLIRRIGDLEQVHVILIDHALLMKVLVTQSINPRQ